MTRALVREVVETMAPQLMLGPRAVEAFVAGARVRHVARGAPVTPEHDTVAGVVLSGIVRLAWAPEHDDSVTVQLVGPRRVFHLGWPFGGDRPPALSASAHVEAEVALLPSDAACECLAALPSAHAVALLEHGCRVLSRGLAVLCALRTLSLAERLLLRCEELARDFGVPDAGGVRLDVPLTHQDLARLVAGSRPNVTRALAGLARTGRIALDGGRILLRQRPVAERRASRRRPESSGGTPRACTSRAASAGGG
jgi:hypothetical protein